MNPADRAAFDAAHDALDALRATPDGLAMFERFADRAKTAGQLVWSAAGPILAVVGNVALEELRAYAASLIATELNKLSGNK